MRHITLLSLAIMMIALSAAGQVYEPTYDKVLIPVQTGQTPGAYGSLWTAVVAVSNMSNTPIDVQGHGACRVDGVECRPEPIPPHTTIYVNLLPRADVPASFLFVEPGRMDDLSITIRAYDKSREHLTWGSTIPVVTRGELFAKPFGIGDIPVSDDFRSTLRLFDFDATTPAAVRVLVYKVVPADSDEMRPGAADALLAELHPAFAVPQQGGTTFFHPAYAAIPLWLVPGVAGAESVRVVIEPLDATGDYWAMASTTHNETQHVTIISPR